MDEVKIVLRRYIEDNFIMGRQVTLADSESFLERHLLDSTGFLELIGYIEETYGIAVEDNEMVPENLDSIDRAARYVVEKRIS